MIQQESIEDIITRCYKKEKKKKNPHFSYFIPLNFGWTIPAAEAIAKLSTGTYTQTNHNMENVSRYPRNLCTEVCAE